ncbi:dihydroorotate dehydrogenase electron transfer subunit [Candidatus Woesearchaeota archaeon]|nr:dihydroorotate dehydrogenase electron transfer subunit [Candidatus Woesearchaeota archaeon]
MKQMNYKKKGCKCIGALQLDDPFPMRMLKIEKIVQENSNVKNFFFNHKLNSKPGQFVMIWLPDCGEKPMSIAQDFGEGFSLAIAAIGKVSSTICCAKVGDYVGIRGPLGTCFSLADTNKKIENKNNNQKNKDVNLVKSIALVGGGYGAGPMASLAELAIKKGLKPENIHYIVGARTKDLLLFHKRLEGTGVNIHVTTDDGSYGIKGRVTGALNNIIKESKDNIKKNDKNKTKDKNKIDKIYTVGPELMMKAVYDVAVRENIDCEISLERYSKCGIGVCGSCAVDPTGERMCIEGPIIGKEKIAKITEFGRYHRDASGNKIRY